MLAEGHPQARKYPLAMLSDEYAIAVERRNAEFSTEAILIKLAISANLAKEGGKLFKDRLDALGDTTIARVEDGRQKG